VSEAAAAASARRRRGVKILAGAASALVAAWAAGFVWFVESLPRPADAPHEAQPTDAIVVLTGGDLRLAEGVRLLADGAAKRLLVTGVHERVDLDQVLSLADDAPAALACCISLGYQALSTAGNAAETADWMAENDFRSLRLVTAYYHMPRSLMEFRDCMPRIAIVEHPVFPDAGNPGEGGRWRRSLAILFTEYNKLLVAYARIHLGLAA
jgi:uncharacterized SAM-binding protein YcdF (DUF218 family)